ncbi:MAG TPA: hypothetical protein VGM90_19935 [Kofleriaceae bacterium]|jgi:hypothetical protein
MGHLSSSRTLSALIFTTFAACTAYPGDVKNLSGVDAAAGDDVDGGSDVGGSDTDLDAGILPDAPPAVCNGYEPCGIHPAMPPAGYTTLASVNVDQYASIYTSCTDFADCGMWNTHYTENWNDTSNQPVAQYFNRMASPFPWVNSRYKIDVSPKKIQYVKLHVPAPGDMYKFSDGTLETRTDRATGQRTCFKRGASMTSASLYNLGGTNNLGRVTWNISVLPGDMGNTGNTSTCTGTGATNMVPITASETTASAPNALGHPVYCLLREGHDYYINYQSASLANVDCTTGVCSMGGWFVSNFVGTDGSQSPSVEVPCP